MWPPFLNCCLFDSTWEASEALRLDHVDSAKFVQAWAKNDHPGFEIPYVFAGGVSKYWPDFLSRLTTGTTLVLEVKGQTTGRDKTERAAMTDWFEAVNADGQSGRWTHEVSRTPSDVQDILARAATA